MAELSRNLMDRFMSMPTYGMAALLLLVLYAVQTEIRFGAKARAIKGGVADRRSTTGLSLALAVPAIGFILAMEGHIGATLPGMPAAA